MVFKNALILIFMILGLSACARSSRVDPIAQEEELQPVDQKPAWPVIARLKAGANPIWFEFTDSRSSGYGNPGQISSPAEASLAEFTPWPFARNSAGMLAFGNNIVLGINRFGFLVFGPDTDKSTAVMYSVPDSTWDDYSIASVFMFEQNPAVLLYRDDFFDIPKEEPPQYPVMILDEKYPAPAGIITGFLKFIFDNDLEANLLRKGVDNTWYVRCRKTNEYPSEAEFFRTVDLIALPEKISQAAFRNSSEPLTALRDFKLIEKMAVAAQEFSGSHVPVLRIISPDFAGARDFASRTVAGNDFSLFFGYNRINTEDNPETAQLAFAVLPDGKGIACSQNGITKFSLPVLPGDFVYTGAGLAGDVLIATWEEQDEFSVGAAGFMVMDSGVLGL